MKLLSRSAAAMILATPLVCAQAVGPYGDRLAVGVMSFSSYSDLTGLPLPAFTNQKLCGVQWVGPDLRAYVYVPTAAERGGNFSPFSGKLVDPLALGFPFPGGLIPASRLPTIMAMRITAAPPAAGEACLVRRSPGFSSLHYVTDDNPSQDQLFPVPANVTLNHTLGNPAPAFNVLVFSPVVPLPYGIIPEYGDSGPTASWLTMIPMEGLSAQELRLGLAPRDLLAGVHSTGFHVGPLARIQAPRPVGVTLNLSVPPNYMQVRRPPPEVIFNKDGDAPESRQINILTLGAASTFSADVLYVTPPPSSGVAWLDVNPMSGAGAQDLTVSFKVSELRKLDRGQYLAYVRVSAPAASVLAAAPVTRDRVVAPLNGAVPNSPQLVPFVLTVFPDADFTVTTEQKPMIFTYPPGAQSEVRRIGLDPVKNPVLPNPITFTVSTTTEDGNNWLSVDPATFQATLTNPNVSYTIEVRLNPQALSALPSNQYNGWVNINAGATTGAEIPVRLAVNQAQLNEQSTRRVLAQIVDGANWKTTITLFNTDTANARQFTLRFRRGLRAVAPNLELQSLGVLTSLQVQDTIKAGGSVTLSTAGTGGQLWEGWAELEAPSAIDGTAIFRLAQNASQDSEGAVPLKDLQGSRLLLPFDNSGSAGQRYDTGFALLNSGDSSANISVTVRNEAGDVVPPVAQAITLGALEHRAFSLPTQIPATAGIRGVVEFSSSGPTIAGLGLRFSPRGNFTSFETVSTGTTAPKKLAHIADGAGWKTSIVLVNPSAAGPVTVAVKFNAGLGTSPSRALPLVGRTYTPGTSFEVSVPPSTSLTLETQGNLADSLWMGWAELNPSGPLSGFAVFRGDRSGIESEGAVPMLSGASARFFVPFDNMAGAVTSLALVNTGSTIRMTFRNEAGTPVDFGGGTVFSQVVQGHTAFELTQPQFQIQGTRGVAEFSTDGQDLLGLGLRFNDPRRAFTSLPVSRK